MTPSGCTTLHDRTGLIMMDDRARDLAWRAQVALATSPVFSSAAADVAAEVEQLIGQLSAHLAAAGAPAGLTSSGDVRQLVLRLVTELRGFVKRLPRSEVSLTSSLRALRAECVWIAGELANIAHIDDLMSMTSDEAQDVSPPLGDRVDLSTWAQTRRP